MYYTLLYILNIIFVKPIRWFNEYIFCFIKRFSFPQKKIISFFILFVIFSSHIIGQQEIYSFSFRKQTFPEIFQHIEDIGTYRFFYNDELVKISKKFTIEFNNVTIEELLNQLLQGANLSYKIIDNQLVVITPDPKKMSGEVSGIVISDQKEPLPGVNIIIKGTNRGSVTGIDGKFKLFLNQPEATIIFSHIGFINEEIDVEPNNDYSIIMEKDLAELEQVIVIGYAELKRSDITGSITSVSKKDIANVKSSNIIESIQGKAAGVDITKDNGSVGSQLNITIRGNRSLGEGGASNDPLYVVDGIPYYGTFNMNPNDIESIEILKDASSTAIYGVAGANGVILITTKKGEYGKSKIEFNIFRGITLKQGELPYSDREYYLKKKRDFVRLNNYQNGGNYFLTDAEVDEIGIYLEQYEQSYLDQNYDFNWYDKFIKDHGTVQDYNINVSGGNEMFQYSTSFSYFNEKSLIQKDDFDRYIVRLNAKSEINSLFSAGASFLGGVSRKSLGNNFKNDLLKLTPLVPDKDKNGDYITYITEDRINPFILQDVTTNLIDEANIFTSFFIQLNFTTNLSLKSTLNIQYQDIEDGTSKDMISQVEKFDATSDLVSQKGTGFVHNNILKFNKEFSKHVINIIAGFEYQMYRTHMERILAGDLITDGNLWYNPTQAQENIIVQLRNPEDLPFEQRALVSYIGRIHYSYKNKYILQVSGRYDGASQLSEGNKWNFFPSASFAWKLNEESFLENYDFISSLKARIGYGVVGNRNIPAYSSLPKLNLSPLYMEFGKLDEDVYYGYWQEQLGNRQLTWEKTKSINFGLDFGFLKHRLNGSIDGYKSFTYDLLQESLSPATSGYKSGFDNVGNVTNTGYEFTITGILLNQKDWYTSLTLLYAKNNEKITELGDGRKADIGKGWFVGQPVDVYYDYVFDGIWQKNEVELARKYNAKPGDVKFRDINGDYIINAEYDKTIIGTPRPKWTGGVTLNASYKNFDLSVSAIARIGQTILDETYTFWSPNGNEAGFALDYWTPNNPINTMPALHPKTIGTYPDIFQLQYTDGSYVKIKDIIVGYNFPEKWINKILISKCRVNISFKNYFIFSKFFNKGRYDPEQGGLIDFPIPKMISYGLNVEF